MRAVREGSTPQVRTEQHVGGGESKLSELEERGHAPLGRHRVEVEVGQLLGSRQELGGGGGLFLAVLLARLI